MLHRCRIDKKWGDLECMLEARGREASQVLILGG